MDLEMLCTNCRELIETTGEFIKKQSNIWKEKRVIKEKSKNSLVTYIDIEAEKILVTGLKKLLPIAGFITEENTPNSIDKELKWIIDPLDGTTNFIHGLPVFSISVALMKKTQVVLGIVYDITREETFYTWEGNGVFLNEKPITVSKCKDLSESLIATGFPYYDYTLLDRYLKVLSYFIQNTRGVRRIGSAALDLAYVACGRFDGFYEYSLNEWDVAAGSYLVQQAGGHVSDFSGNDNFIFGREIIASSPAIFPDFIHLLKP